MQLGFLGTGEITAAIVSGLCSGDTSHSIYLSPRNRIIATDLACRFPGVSIASSNQDLLDRCKTVVIAVKPQVARDVLSALRFSTDHCVISVVSSLAVRSISELVAPAMRVTRAVPLPSVAQRIGPTALYPHDALVKELFAVLGTPYVMRTEDEFDAMCAATATIASYLAYIGGIESWLNQKGIPESESRDYVGRMFWGVTTVAVNAPDRSFRSLASSHATAGGINDLFLRYLVGRGVLAAVPEGLDVVQCRIRERSSGGFAQLD